MIDPDTNTDTDTGTADPVADELIDFDPFFNLAPYTDTFAPDRAPYDPADIAPYLEETDHEDAQDEAAANTTGAANEYRPAAPAESLLAFAERRHLDAVIDHLDDLTHPDILQSTRVLEETLHAILLDSLLLPLPDDEENATA